MLPHFKIKTTWSKELAYAIGLITTDGNLSKDGRHLTFVSKDLPQINLFKKCLGIKNRVCLKKSGFVPDNTSYFIQFGDVNFYKFLVNIGLGPAKSKIMKELKIPDKYFFHFLRGHFDGDGTFFSYWDKRWASSFMFYLIFLSASFEHVKWIQQSLLRLLKVKGHFNLSKMSTISQLKYAKKESSIILNNIYYNSVNLRLERKYKKVYTALAINKKNF